MQIFRQSRYLFLLLLILSSNLWAADGHLIQVSGQVRVNGLIADDSAKINKGDKITTGAGASVKLVLTDGSVIDIKSESEIDINDYLFAPEDEGKNTSDISIIKGALRYISGLIAKTDPTKISFLAGTATIGVRGTYSQIAYDGKIVKVDSSVGIMTITFTGQPTSVVGTGQSGVASTQTATVAIALSTVPDAVGELAKLIAKSPKDTTAIEDAMAKLSTEDLALTVAVLINNARALNVDPATITATVASVVSVKPAAAAIIVVVASILDKTNAETYKDAAIGAAPGQTNAIENAVEKANKIIDVLTTQAANSTAENGATAAPQLTLDLSNGSSTSGPAASPALPDITDKKNNGSGYSR
jgi:hypothetical protein